MRNVAAATAATVCTAQGVSTAENSESSRSAGSAETDLQALRKEGVLVAAATGDGHHERCWKGEEEEKSDWVQGRTPSYLIRYRQAR